MTEYVVPVDDGLARLLEMSLDAGPILHENEEQQYDVRKALVGNVNGFKVEIFSNEHPPPHFRVKYQGMTANFRISDCVALNGDNELVRKFSKNMKKWWKTSKPHLIKFWNERRPADCPVGEYKG